jgi:hypothetical protein
MLPAEKGVVEAAGLVGRFGLNGGHLLAATVLIDGDKNEVGAGDVKMGAGLRILDPDLNAYFKRCIESTVDTGLEYEQVADVDGLDEVDVIHGRGDDVGARVAVGRDGAGDIDEMHETAAEQVAESVGVIGKDDLSHLGLGAGNGTDKRLCISRAHLLVAPSFHGHGFEERRFRLQ